MATTRRITSCGWQPAAGLPGHELVPGGGSDGTRRGGGWDNRQVSHNRAKKTHDRGRSPRPASTVIVFSSYTALKWTDPEPEQVGVEGGQALCQVSSTMMTDQDDGADGPSHATGYGSGEGVAVVQTVLASAPRSL